jgi:hypothetical protein
VQGRVEERKAVKITSICGLFLSFILPGTVAAVKSSILMFMISFGTQSMSFVYGK